MAQKILNNPKHNNMKHKKVVNPKQVLVNSSMANLPIGKKFLDKSPYAPDHSIYKQHPTGAQT